METMKSLTFNNSFLCLDIFFCVNEVPWFSFKIKIQSRFQAGPSALLTCMTLNCAFSIYVHSNHTRSHPCCICDSYLHVQSLTCCSSSLWLEALPPPGPPPPGPPNSLAVLSMKWGPRSWEGLERVWRGRSGHSWLNLCTLSDLHYKVFE